MTDEESPSEVAGDVNKIADQLRDDPGFYEKTARPLLRRIEIALPALAALGLVFYLAVTEGSVPVAVDPFTVYTATLVTGIAGSVLLWHEHGSETVYAEGPGSRLDLEDED